MKKSTKSVWTILSYIVILGFIGITIFFIFQNPLSIIPFFTIILFGLGLAFGNKNLSLAEKILGVGLVYGSIGAMAGVVLYFMIETIK